MRQINFFLIGRLQGGSHCFQGRFFEPNQVGNTMFNLQGAMQGWEWAWVDKSGAASHLRAYQKTEGSQYLQGSWYRQTQVLNVQSAGGNAGGVGVGLSGAGYGGRALPCPGLTQCSPGLHRPHSIWIESPSLAYGYTLPFGHRPSLARPEQEQLLCKGAMWMARGRPVSIIFSPTRPPYLHILVFWGWLACPESMFSNTWALWLASILNTVIFSPSWPSCTNCL